jgi:hypothetical protein
MEPQALCKLIFLWIVLSCQNLAGLDNMLRSYLIDEVSNLEMEDAFVNTYWDVRKGKPYVIAFRN